MEKVTRAVTGAALLTGVVFLGSCSQYSQKPASVAFHNLAANYNAYFIAKADLDSADWAMAEAYTENYNQLMPILLPVDSVLAQPFRKHLDDAIKKTSIVAEKHQNSKWLDNSYTLLGKARLYLGQLDDAVEAFRYVFSKSEDETDKNEALVLLMRAYIEQKEYSNALSVSEHLRQQPLSKEATVDFYLTKAYLHQKTGEYLTSVAILEETFPLLKKSQKKARLHYIAGQLYDKLEKYQLANRHYDRVQRNKPVYNLSFFARMNALQNTALLNPGVTVSEAGFEKMLKDRKNEDLKDKIYYTMGMLAERKGDYPAALGYLQASVKANSSNQAQVPYTYMEMARINLDFLGAYEPAKAYYDSAVAMLPANDPMHKQVTERKNVLDEFVAQMTIIRTEDSLQRIAQLSPEALHARLNEIVDNTQKEKKREFEREQAARAAAKLAGNSPASPVTGPRWALYDPAMVSQGKNEFTKKWGNRRLEDDWRRQNRSGPSFAGNDAVATANAQEAPGADPERFKEITPDSEEWKAMYEGLKKAIPLTDSAMTASHSRKETALYTLGKIYWNTFRKSQKAVETFDRLMAEYPATDYKQEVYYLMYLCLPDTDAKKQQWKQKLIAEYPSSMYVSFLDSDATGKTTTPAGKIYEEIYALYTAGRNKEALEEVNKALPLYRDSPSADRFALLRLFIIGKTEGVQAYKAAILEFMRLYPESQYIPRTREMLAVAEQAALLPRN